VIVKEVNMKKKRARFILGYIMFIIGLSIGLAFSTFALWVNLEGMSFWGYPESISYDPDLSVEAEISRLKCPVLLAEGETSLVAVTVRNPFDKPALTYVKAHISMPDRLENMVRRTRSAYLSPGEETEIRWQISSENTIFDHMILARVFLKLTESHPPARTKHCGIMSVDLWGLSSKQILTIVPTSSIALMTIGGHLIWRSRTKDPKKVNLGIKITNLIGVLTVIGVIASLLRIWEIILVVLTLIPVILFSAISYHIGRMDSRYN